MKLMIVDDEPDIRNGIKEGIDWAKIGITRVFAAGTAQEALRIYKAEQPQIVITDISMPRMSGIELIEKIQEINENTRCILLSGYSDFAYAQKAIRLGVISYELKPIKVSRLIELVKSLKEQIETKEQEKNALKLNAYSDSQYFIKKLVQEKGISEKEEFEEGLRSLKIGETDAVCCLYIQLDRYRHRRKLLFDHKDYMERMRGLCEKWLGGEQFFLIRLASDSAFILMKNNTGGKKKIPRMFLEMNEMTKEFFDLSFSMGVSEDGCMKDFYRLFIQSKTAVRNKIYTGRVSLIYYSDEKNNKEISSHYLVDKKMYENIQREYLNDDLQTVQETLQSRFGEIQKLRSYTYTTLYDFSVDLINLLYRICQEYPSGQLKSRELAVEEMEDTCDTIEEFCGYICQLYEEFHEQIKKQRYPTQNKAVQEALACVKLHYAENLSIEKIAESMGVTPNYLSHLFNREMKMSFREYLNQYRIGRAKWYLENTNDKAYEIAQKVGFHEYKHFAQIFKKYEGCSTLQYRNQEHQ
ncbi:MAG: response regulator [Eubacteriales bacterium]|nr:response regulator [Eubacteriales bacterium]